MPGDGGIDALGRIAFAFGPLVEDPGGFGKGIEIAAKTAAKIGEPDFAGKAPAALLRELNDAIMALDFPRATAVADAYLQSDADRRAYMETVALCACRFQDDPHNQKITISTFEEYGHNSTHLKDRLLLATPRLLAGWVKMPGERDCFARFEKEWIYN